MFNDTLIDSTIWMLRKAFKNNKARIWKALEEEFQKSRSNRRLVNIQKLNKFTDNGDIIIVPGKDFRKWNFGTQVNSLCIFIFRNRIKQVKCIRHGNNITTIINK